MLYRTFLAFLTGFLALIPQLHAELKVHAPVVKLGEILGGPPLTQRFAFTNKGTRQVELLDVERGCNCLEAEFDKRTLAPGESGTLNLTLRTLGHKNGPYAWNAKVRYRPVEPSPLAPENGGKDEALKQVIKEAHVRLEGTIRNEVTLEPSELVLFITGELKQEVRVTDLRDQPFEITRVETTLPGVTFESRKEKPGHFRVLLHAQGSLIPYGSREGRVDFYTDDPMYAMLSLPVRVIRSYPKAVHAIPERIRLNPAAGVKSALIRLRPADEKPLKIARVEAPGLKCTWADHPAGGLTLRLTPAEATIPPVIRIVFEGAARELELPVDVD